MFGAERNQFVLSMYICKDEQQLRISSTENQKDICKIYETIVLLKA